MSLLAAGTSNIVLSLIKLSYVTNLVNIKRRIGFPKWPPWGARAANEPQRSIKILTLDILELMKCKKVFSVVVFRVILLKFNN